MSADAARQVEGLRAAAAQLGGPVNTLQEISVPTWSLSEPQAGGIARTRRVMTLPGDIARAIARVLMADAERIEARGSALGLQVNYSLEIGGAVLGQDLGHNR